MLYNSLSVSPRKANFFRLYPNALIFYWFILGHQSGSSLLSSSLSGVLPPPQGPPELVGTAPSPSAAPCSTPLSHHISGQSGGVYISPPGSHDGLVKATNAVIAGASNATVYALAVAAAQAQQHQQLSPQSQQQQPSHAHPLLANPYPRGPICPQPMASNHLNSTSHSPTLANANSISANPAVSLAGLLAPGTAQHSVPSLTYTTHIPDSSGLLSLSNNAGTATSSAQPSILLTNGPGQSEAVTSI
ncbi:unnamed protein product [Protopolystoma xenopodis]|uniref:Uncharacterized protein n=1 Tax=Protopolystoma xenopodis TaxID=117903 RepID=A0A3S5BZR6_9PLAT|nr:unnamed protein product [Protopolystoma xenopodis]